MQFILKLIQEDRIKVVPVKDTEQKKKLIKDFNIYSAEAEAIVFALQKDCKVIATDDRNAIRACKVLGLDFVTAISVLIRAYEKGFLDRAEALSKLERLTIIGRYSKKIINDAKTRITGGVGVEDEDIEYTHR